MKEISKIKEDYFNYKEKNLEKMKEIEFLEKQVDKLKSSYDALKEEKSKLEKKLVDLETENSDLTNKVRELECWSEELKAKLDAALEENIIIHNENDAFKMESDETIQRLQEELEELKGEIAAKEKIISKIQMHRDFILKTAYNAQDDINNNIINAKSYQSLKSREKINITTP